ncbi:MAG: DUF3108 domain-containing protein [Puniceicoccaceae bacterium]|nr:MAG: DUF3108 domain-containing protein [Puniceicoccaceae bacterium]
MIRRLSLLALPLFFLPPLAAAGPETHPRLGPGESFEFRISWGFFGNAGKVQVDTAKGSSAQPNLEVRTTASTQGLIRALYTVESETVARIDTSAPRLLSLETEGVYGARDTHYATTIDRQAGLVRHVDHHRPDRTADRPLPDREPLDLLSAILLLRHRELQPGTIVPIKVVEGGRLYGLNLSVAGPVEVTSPLGRHRALLLEPMQIPNEEESIRFLDQGGSLSLWVSDDPLRLPLKMEVKVRWGTASLALTRYEGHGLTLEPDDTQGVRRPRRR